MATREQMAIRQLRATERIRAAAGLHLKSVKGPPDAKLAVMLEQIAEHLDPERNFVVEPEVREEPPPGGYPTEVEEDDAGDAGDAGGLESLTVAELRERAKTAGVHGYSSMAKAELIEAVRAAEAEPTSPPPAA